VVHVPSQLLVFQLHHVNRYFVVTSCKLLLRRYIIPLCHHVQEAHQRKARLILARDTRVCFSSSGYSSKIWDCELYYKMNDWVKIATWKKIVWSTRIGRMVPIRILCLIPGSGLRGAAFPLGVMRSGVVKPVLTRFLGDLVLYTTYIIIYLFLFRLTTLLSPSFMSIRTGDVYGPEEGGVNNGGRLGFWRILQLRWTPAKSSTIHAFENIRVYIEYSHHQFRIYGLNAGLWNFEELQVPTEVLTVLLVLLANTLGTGTYSRYRSLSFAIQDVFVLFWGWGGGILYVSFW